MNARKAMTASTGGTTDELFMAAYTQYAPMVRRIILGRLSTSDYNLADDLSQNVFLELYRIRNRYDMARDLGGLLTMMARQSVSHHFRVMRNTREVPADTGHWSFTNSNLSPAASGACEVVNTGFRTARIGGVQ